MAVNNIHYEEETDERLKKMIDFIIIESEKYQIKEEETETPDWVVEQDKLISEGKMLQVYDEQIKWIQNNKDINVAICIPSYDGNISIRLLSSLLMMPKPNFKLFYTLGHAIDAQRNDLAKSALEWKDCTHILFMDSDTVPPPFGIIRMLQRGVDVISGFYMQNQHPFAPLVIKRPMNKETGKTMVNFFPNIHEHMKSSMVKADGSGGGFLLIKRKVYESIKQPYFRTTMIEGSDYTKVVGEDLFFFDKIKDIGFQLWVDLSVRCEHITGRNSFPEAFMLHHLDRGPKSSDTIRTFNNSAMLYAGGYNVDFFKQLMIEEEKRKVDKAKKETKQNGQPPKNKSKKIASRRKTTKDPPSK